jgi:hypothetical protein
MAESSADEIIQGLLEAARRHEDLARIIDARADEQAKLYDSRARRHEAEAAALRDEAAAWADEIIAGPSSGPTSADAVHGQQVGTLVRRSRSKPASLPLTGVAAANGGTTWPSRIVAAMETQPEREWTVREIVTACAIEPGSDTQGRHLEVARKTLKRMVPRGRVERTASGNWRLAHERREGRRLADV